MNYIYVDEYETFQEAQEALEYELDFMPEDHYLKEAKLWYDFPRMCWKVHILTVSENQEELDV